MDNKVNEVLRSRLESAQNSQPLVNGDEVDSIVNELTTVNHIEENDTVDEIVSNTSVSVTVQEEESAPSAPQVGDELFEDLERVKEENEKMAQEIEEKNKEAAFNAEHPHVSEAEEIGYVSKDDEVQMILNQIDEDTEQAMDGADIDIQENDSIEDLLTKYEESKKYSDTEANKYYAGPSNYVVETDETFLDTVDNILNSNNIKYTKVSNKERNAVLERFVNSGPKVSVALPNSGIYVQFAGAGVDELIAMSKIESRNVLADELNKLQHVASHITNSSVGPLKLNQLIDIVSFWDIETLYYGLFAATHPDTIEISRECTSCHNSYFIKTNTRDLHTNYEEFEKSEDDIRDNVTTYKRLIESSKLGKVHKKVHSNGMIIYFKHPSIRNYLNKYNAITTETATQYEDILSYIFSIDKIALPNLDSNDNSYVEFTDPNEIIRIIAGLKNADDRYEIEEIIEELIPSVMPVYGYKDTVCPHCGALNKAAQLNIPSLLFTLATDEGWLASVKRAGMRSQKKKKISK